ncbi:hypothetical protein KY385_02700 [Candidatus Parcubacteria bacterium]|nr:hypothetical protein [Candidatus Parcubacteria bacterium]
MDIKPPKKRRVKDFNKIANQAPAKQTKQNMAQDDNDLRSKISGVIDKAKPSGELPKIKEVIGSHPSDLKQLILDNKLLILYTLLIFSLAFFLYLYRISSLPKPTSLDSPTALNVQSFTDLSSNIVFGPPKFLDYLLLKLNLATALGLRLSSILFTVLALVFFFLIIKRWLGIKVSVLATLLLATSTWTIMQTRDSNFMNVFFLIVPTLLLTGSYMKRKPESLWIFPFVFLLGVLTYVPGFMWFLLFASAVYFKNIINLFDENQLKRSIGIVFTYILPVLPLAYFLANRAENVKLWLGLPSETSFELQTILNNLAELPVQLFITGVNEPLLWLFGSPVFDAAAGILALAGILFIAKDKLHPVRRLTLGGLFLITLGLLSVGGSVYISLLLPFIYILASFGIYYLLTQWFSIFPLNPFARSIGYVLICALVLGISFYHVSRYFIVWPRNERVIEAFESVSSDTIDERLNNKFYLPRSNDNESR